MAINVTGNRLTINTGLTFTISGSLLLVEKSAITAAQKPYRLNNYYRNSNRVPLNTVLNKIPLNGKIALKDFYGEGRLPFSNGERAFTTPGDHSFTVPANIYIMSVVLLGAGGGGSGGSDGGYRHNGPGGVGGSAGAYWTGSFSVIPGQVLSLHVGYGGAGGASSCCNNGAGGNGESSLISGVVAVSGGAGAGAENHCNDGLVRSPTAGQSSGMGFGGSPGSVNSPGGNGGYGAGGGGGGNVVGSCVGSATGGYGGSGYIKLTW